MHKLSAAKLKLDMLLLGIADTKPVLRHLCVQNIQKAQNRYEHKTKVAWNPWRPIVLAVLFGLLMLFAIIACCLAISRRFPRTTAAFTLLLWIVTSIFFILGSGKASLFTGTKQGHSTLTALILNTGTKH